MIEAFIFDIDGTLIDSNDFHARAWQKAFAKYDKEILFDKIWASVAKFKIVGVLCGGFAEKSFAIKAVLKFIETRRIY